jgi:signal peptidase I
MSWWKRDKSGTPKVKSVIRQYAESIGWAVGIALLIRIFLFEPFKIPTGSMIPTLQIGDHIFVSKSAYGIKLPFASDYLYRWDEPKRGDIVVFPFPVKGHQDYGKDFIKRIVGLPGDRVRLTDNTLYINDQPVETSVLPGERDCSGSERRPCSKCTLQRETLGEHSFITQYCAPRGVNPEWPRLGMSPEPPVFRIPEGHVFVMGDNRDNSSDGRFWTADPLDQYTPQFAPDSKVQTVPIALLRGRAVVIWWADDKSRLFSLVE